MILFVKNVVCALVVLILPVALIALLFSTSPSLVQLVLFGTVLFIGAYLVKKEKGKIG